MKQHTLTALLVLISAAIQAGTVQPPTVSDVDNLFLLSDAQSRSISAENITGGKGMGSQVEVEDGPTKGRNNGLGKGWKVSPFVNVKGGKTVVMGEAEGPGMINHIWMTLGAKAEFRDCIFRIYWDDETEPSVEVPAGDFFASGWGRDRNRIIDSSVVSVLPKSGFNCWWQMPFRKKFKMTMENRGSKPLVLYYQIDYSLTEIPDNAAYFHAQFRQQRPVKKGDVFTVIDGVKGQGHYVGTYIARAAFALGWWGEGEIKFYMDGDTEYPTINGTGEEDYFLGSYGYNNPHVSHAEARDTGNTGEFSSLYAGFCAQPDPVTGSVNLKPDAPERRYSQYRWHIKDPIRFQSDLRVTLQSLGLHKSFGGYHQREDNVSSVAYWYQTEPHAPFPKLPSKKELAIPPYRTTK